VASVEPGENVGGSIWRFLWWVGVQVEDFQKRMAPPLTKSGQRESSGLSSSHSSVSEKMRIEIPGRILAFPHTCDCCGATPDLNVLVSAIKSGGEASSND
jgi:hypothetical protein